MLPGAMMGASLLLLLGLGPYAVLAQGGQMKAPSWMSDDGKELFNDIFASERPFDAATCEQREGLLKTLMGNSHKEASQFRWEVLRGLGMCEFIQGNYEKAKKRLDSGVSELNLPNDDMMLTNQDLAPTGLLRQAAGFMVKTELTQAATALRRSREIDERNIKKILKMVHKQIGNQGNVPPVQNLIDEIPGFGKTGQILPELMKQAPILKQVMPFYEQIDKLVEELDKQLTGFAPQQKAIRKTLDTSKGSKAGTLMYVRGLIGETTAPADRLMAAMDMVESGAVEAFKEEGASLEKGLTLIKRTKEGAGCKDGKGMTKTCAALAKTADLKSNSFGETRVVVVKPGKKQPLETCSTNANLGILLAAKDGVTATVAGTKSTLTTGLPLVVDFCQEVSLEATAPVAVLFAQVWHPEFAAVERSGEIRARAKTFDLSEDDIKEATKIVNDHAKKNWEKSAKQWRNESPFIESLKTSLNQQKEDAKAAAEAAAEAKKKDEEDNDEGRKKNLAELERKRAEKKQRAQEAEEKRKARAKQLQDEKANRDPWLNSPDVVAAEENLHALKEARRDANAKLEFDLTSSLTKDISAAERLLKKETKKAKKAFKKDGKIPTATTDKAEATAEKSTDKAADKPVDNSAKVADIKAKLEDVKKRKAEAAEQENFAEAKKLKATQKELEDKLKKLEL